MKSDAQDLLTPEQLVERWAGAVTLATLSTWRSRGGGPKFVRIGRQPRYRLADIEEYERKNQHE